MVQSYFQVMYEERTGDYEVVMWKNNCPVTVQTGLRTEAKANVALAKWEQLEREMQQRAENKT